MFQQLYDAIPDNGSMSLSLVNLEDGKRCVTALPSSRRVAGGTGSLCFHG